VRPPAELHAEPLVHEDDADDITVLVPEKHLHVRYLPRLLDREVDPRRHRNAVGDLAVDDILDPPDLLRRDLREMREVEPEMPGRDE
jgi:hypothetical protein